MFSHDDLLEDFPEYFHYNIASDGERHVLRRELDSPYMTWRAPFRVITTTMTHTRKTINIVNKVSRVSPIESFARVEK